jgi:5-methylcytosine-specific restriction endonuclease McrA
MPTYNGITGSNAHAPYGVCPRCGWEGRDWGFKYRNLCKKCHRQWRKDRANRHREGAPTNGSVQLTDGIVVTEHVERRLRRRAERQPGPVIIQFLMVLIPVALFVGAGHLYSCVGSDSANNVLSMAILLGALIIPLGVAGLAAILRERLVNRKTLTLAESRKKSIEEQRTFYSSPEWRILREQVIGEQGRRCQKCGRQIVQDFDLTVDHIKPRSKFPDLALDKSNLQVLCRACNSTKGAAHSGSEITPDDLTSRT